MSSIFFFLFGIIIGSFLNVVIFRLQTNESIGGRSHCQNCKAMIRWYDNIPVLSYLLLGGACRHCKAAISKQYPLVEFMTGLAFAIIGYFVFQFGVPHTYGVSLFYLLITALLIIVFVYDLSTLYIPMSIIWIAIASTAIFYALSWYFGAVTESQSTLLQLGLYFAPLTQSPTMYLASAFGAFLFFWILVAISHETWMGMGDAYLAILIGLLLGFPGTLWSLTLSFGMGAIIGSVLVAFGKKGMKSQVPFAPFLALGTYIFLILPYAFPELSYYLIW